MPNEFRFKFLFFWRINVPSSKTVHRLFYYQVDVANIKKMRYFKTRQNIRFLLLTGSGIQAYTWQQQSLVAEI